MSIRVSGLSEDENLTVNALLDQLQAKTVRNRLRQKLYDMKQSVRQVSEVLPPQYSSLGITLGWTAQAVDLLSLRTRLSRFVWADGDLDSTGYKQVWDQNMLGVELPTALDSALIQSVSFVSTTRGADSAEPDVLWRFYDALDATGEWNVRTRRLDSFLHVTRRDQGNVVEFVAYLPGVIVTCEKAGGWRVVDRQVHGWHVPVEPLPYSPRVGREFGRSRISRAMIGLQGAAVRELLRLEGHMDIYSYPEYWMLGADPSLFTGQDGMVQTAWNAMMGRIKGVPDDPEAQDANSARADVRKFDASSPEPHLAALNALAKLFAREASLPDSSLAITDLANPTSAEAYDASQHDLIAKAEGATDGWSPFLRRAMIRSLAMLDENVSGADDVPDAFASIDTDWRDPRFVSRSAAADAGSKQIGTVPWLAETSVGLDLVGLTDQQQELALSERRRNMAGSRIERMAAAAREVTIGDGGGSEVSDGGEPAVGVSRPV